MQEERELKIKCKLLSLLQRTLKGKKMGNQLSMSLLPLDGSG